MTIALVFSDRSGRIYYIFKHLKVVDASLPDAAVAIINSTQCYRIVNRSLCQITSLEVYRGRDQIIEISHGGLSLSENGKVKV